MTGPARPTVKGLAKTMWNRDPLLAAARLALAAAMGFTALLTIAFAIGAPAVLILNEQIMGEIASRGRPPETIWAVIGVIAMSGVISALGFFFFRNLYRIVASVEDGDPFIPANAGRLQGMGWIAVAVHLLGIPLAMTSKWLNQFVSGEHNGFEFSYFGLLLALVLFVLARVFREGAKMRDELEGTV